MPRTAFVVGIQANWGRWAGLRLACLVSLILAMLPTAPAMASVDADSAQELPDVRMVERRLPRPWGKSNLTSTGFWVWSQGQRGYFLGEAKSSTQHGTGYFSAVAVDLESGSQVAQATLDPPGYANPGDNYAVGSERAVEIDQETGRVFVATQRALGTDVSGVCGRYSSAGVAEVPRQCLSGVSVLDGNTLDLIRHIPIRKLRTDGTHVGMELLRMRYSPPSGDWGGKLHLLVQETAQSGGYGNFSSIRTRPQSVVLISLMQIDVASGAEDWIVRLDSCRGNLESNRSSRTELEAFRHQAAILRVHSDTDRAMYVACHFVSQSFQGGVVRVPLDANGYPPALPVDADDTSPGRVPPKEPAAPSGERLISIGGPERVYEMMADPDSGRIVMQVLDGKPLAEVWWVFDTSRMRFLGTVGIGGPTKLGDTLSALDHGRLYVLARPRAANGRSFAGGLFVADIGRATIAQALTYPNLVDAYPVDIGSEEDRWELNVQRLEGGARRLWYPEDRRPHNLAQYRAIEDHRAEVADDQEQDYAGRTLDLDEIEGVTSSTLDGVARGYGVRMLLVGGIEALARIGPADPIGMVEQCSDSDWGKDAPGIPVETNYRAGAREANKRAGSEVVPDKPLINEDNGGGPCHYLRQDITNACLHGDREIILASVGPDGPAVVDAGGARGSAVPVRIDSMTAADAERVQSRCTRQDWDQIWGTVLFSRPPAAEPRVELHLEDLAAECVSGGDVLAAQAGDPVSDGYSAAVDCGQERAEGHAYARGFSIEGASAAEALSSFRIYRDPARGVVSRVESVARGINIAGVLRVDTVRGIAESWANGRNQPLPAEDRDEGYNANCDLERTAGTCFTRHLFGVWTPEWSCGPCGDEHALVDGLDAALSPLGISVALREPDLRLRRGAENGFAAAIQKPEADRFGDMVLNSDLLQTVLPTFEVVRSAPPNRIQSRMGARGRQIYQFAGVEVSSAYGIQCLLVYDEALNTCGAVPQEQGGLTVRLEDSDGKPLAGGVFEVRKDVDADGVIGLVDTLLAEGACVTADDGVGTCTFEGLQPGPYLVSQTAAPEGFAKVDEPWLSEVAAGEARTVAFTNTSNVSTVVVNAADADGKPLAGATFAVYGDPDGDGKVAADAQPVATCNTDSTGSCTMSVPAGSYVLAQTGAPAGLELIEPVAFAFASGGQIAAVGITNYPVDGVPSVEPAASPVYTAPSYSPPVETVTDYTPPATLDTPRVSVPDAGRTIVQIIKAPGDILRLLARDPKQAVAFTAALLLFVIALMAIRRRALALELMQ